MDADTKRDIEDLKVALKAAEAEEENLLHDLEQVRARKSEIKEKLRKLSNDEKYQADMLAMVYEQRQKMQKK